MAIALTDWASVWALVQSVSVGLWLQVLGLVLFNFIVRFWRWNHLMMSLGHRLPLGRHITVYLSAFARVVYCTVGSPVQTDKHGHGRIHS